MPKTVFCYLLGLTLPLFFQFVASSSQPAKSSIAVNNAWLRPTPPGTTITAFYAIIHNRGPSMDRLEKASSPAAKIVELHLSENKSGMMMMRPVPDGVSIPPNGKLQLEPGGYHLMMIGLKNPIKPDSRVLVILTFEKAGEVRVYATARMHGGDSRGHGSQHPGGMKPKMRKGKKRRK